MREPSTSPGPAVHLAELIKQRCWGGALASRRSVAPGHDPALKPSLRAVEPARGQQAAMNTRVVASTGPGEMPRP